MKMLYVRLTILVFVLFFTGCGSSSSDSSANSETQTAQTAEVPSNEPVSLVNIYGNLPHNEKSSIEVIFDMNSNGVIDQNETDHKLLYQDLSTNYALNRLNTYQASKMWITYSSDHNIPQTKTFNLTSDTYNINIETYTLQDKLNVTVEREEANKYLIFLVKQLNGGLDISHIYSSQKNIDNATALFQLSIPVAKLSANITNINAYFNDHIDDALRKPHTVNDKERLLDISQSISYALYDQDDNPITLNKKDIFTNFNTRNIDMTEMNIFAFEHQKLQKVDTQGDLSSELDEASKTVQSQLLLAKTLQATEPQNVCVKVQDKQQGSVKSVLAEGHSSLAISSNYSDSSGEVILQIYQDINQYQFDYSIHNQSLYNEAFTVSSSSKNNCSYEATITIDDSNLKSLNLTVIEENNESLEGEYLYAHNSDFSFYTYGYLEANGSVVLKIPQNEAVTIVIGSQKYAIAASETSKTLHYTKNNNTPKLYLYFDKKNTTDDFPQLYVMGVADTLNDYTPAVQQVLKGYNASSSLELQQTEIYDGFKIWAFAIDEKMPSENDFNVVLANGVKEAKQTISHKIEDYPTKIQSINFIDPSGNKHTYTDTLYTDIAYIIEYDIFDKNNNIQSISNSISLDNQVIFTLYNRHIIINVLYNNSNLTFSQSFNLEISQHPPLVDNSAFLTDVEYADLTSAKYTFEVDVVDSLGYENNLTTAIYLGHPSYGNKVSDTHTYAHDYKNEKSFYLYYVATTSSGYSQTFFKYIRLRNYTPILNQNFILNPSSYLNTTIRLSLDVENPAEAPLTYAWYVNDSLISSTRELEYTFQSTGEYTVKCIVNNEVGGTLEVSKTTNVIEGVKIIDISEIKNKTLMGNYTFTVEAAEALGADINYSWSVNGVVKSTSSTLSLSLLEDGQIVAIECIASSIHGSETYTKTTKVYYPTPIIQTPLGNIVLQASETHLFQINAINQSEISEDTLKYAWYLDNNLVSNDEIYDYIQPDNNEHTLKCTVTNKYKSTTTQSKIGNVSLNDFVIQTLEGNKVYIYDDEMSILQSFDVNESGEVIYETVKSKLNVSSVFTENTVLTPLLFSKLLLYAVPRSNIIFDEKRISVRQAKEYRGYAFENYPYLYTFEWEVLSQPYEDDLLSSNTNNDDYLDINELHAFGLSKYDTNNDGKIQVNEIKTYEDQNVTMKLAHLSKGFDIESIDLGEEVFIDAFKKISDIYSENILYPSSEYVEMNVTITDIPSSFKSYLSYLYKSKNNHFELTEYAENHLNDTLTGEFRLQIHHPDQENKLVTFMIYDISEEYSGSTNKAKLFEQISYEDNSHLTISYTNFTPMGVAESSRAKGNIISNINSIDIHTGFSSGYPYNVYFDNASLTKYGTFFNLTTEEEIESEHYELNSLFMYHEILNTDDAYEFSRQHLNIGFMKDSTNENIWSIDGDDTALLDRVSYSGHTSSCVYDNRNFHHIIIEDKNTETLRFLDNNTCQQLFSTPFCQDIPLEDSWSTTAEVKAIEFKDDVDQDLNAPSRMKSILREERGEC